MTTTTFLPLIQGEWTLLGVGPLLVQALSGAALYVISDTEPGSGQVGFSLGVYERDQLWTTSQVWASAAANDAEIVFGPMT
jgi:hypothetical protein